MGVLFFFDEVINDDEKGSKLSLEVCDNHSIPEVRIGPEHEAYKGNTISFSDWKQFERFADSVNDLRLRLEGLHKN